MAQVPWQTCLSSQLNCNPAAATNLSMLDMETCGTAPKHEPCWVGTLLPAAEWRHDISSSHMQRALKSDPSGSQSKPGRVPIWPKAAHMIDNGPALLHPGQAQPWFRARLNPPVSVMVHFNLAAAEVAEPEPEAGVSNPT